MKCGQDLAEMCKRNISISLLLHKLVKITSDLLYYMFGVMLSRKSGLCESARQLNDETLKWREQLVGVPKVPDLCVSPEIDPRASGQSM